LCPIKERTEKGLINGRGIRKKKRRSVRWGGRLRAFSSRRNAKMFYREGEKNVKTKVNRYGERERGEKREKGGERMS